MSDEGSWNIYLDSLNHTVRDLKRLILNKINKPFYFHHTTNNNEMKLGEYALIESTTVDVQFDMSKYSVYAFRREDKGVPSVKLLSLDGAATKLGDIEAALKAKCDAAINQYPLQMYIDDTLIKEMGKSLKDCSKKKLAKIQFFFRVIYIIDG